MTNEDIKFIQNKVVVIEGKRYVCELCKIENIDVVFAYGIRVVINTSSASVYISTNIVLDRLEAFMKFMGVESMSDINNTTVYKLMYDSSYGSIKGFLHTEIKWDDEHPIRYFILGED